MVQANNANPFYLCGGLCSLNAVKICFMSFWTLRHRNTRSLLTLIMQIFCHFIIHSNLHFDNELGVMGVPLGLPNNVTYQDVDNGKQR